MFTVYNPARQEAAKRHFTFTCGSFAELTTKMYGLLFNFPSERMSSNYATYKPLLSADSDSKSGPQQESKAVHTKCSWCGRQPMYWCGACLQVDYCSRQCQELDWRLGGHKKACKRLEVGDVKYTMLQAVQTQQPGILRATLRTLAWPNEYLQNKQHPFHNYFGWEDHYMFVADWVCAICAALDLYSGASPGAKARVLQCLEIVICMAPEIVWHCQIQGWCTPLEYAIHLGTPVHAIQRILQCQPEEADRVLPCDLAALQMWKPALKLFRQRGWDWYALKIIDMLAHELRRRTKVSTGLSRHCIDYLFEALSEAREMSIAERRYLLYCLLALPRPDIPLIQLLQPRSTESSPPIAAVILWTLMYADATVDDLKEAKRSTISRKQDQTAREWMRSLDVLIMDLRFKTGLGLEDILRRQYAHDFSATFRHDLDAADQFITGGPRSCLKRLELLEWEYDRWTLEPFFHRRLTWLVAQQQEFDNDYSTLSIRLRDFFNHLKFMRFPTIDRWWWQCLVLHRHPEQPLLSQPEWTRVSETKECRVHCLGQEVLGYWRKLLEMVCSTLRDSGWTSGDLLAMVVDYLVPCYQSGTIDKKKVASLSHRLLMAIPLNDMLQLPHDDPQLAWDYLDPPELQPSTALALSISADNVERTLELALVRQEAAWLDLLQAARVQTGCVYAKPNTAAVSAPRVLTYEDLKRFTHESVQNYRLKSVV